MLRARIFDLRGAATFAHAPVRFYPGRNCGLWLRPVGYGCLVAPLHKMWHRGLVGPRDHELPHTLLAIPGGHGPEGPASIGQYCTRLKSARASYLPQRPPGVKCEERHKSKGTDSEACQTDESHSLLRLKNFQSNPLHLVLTIGGSGAA